MVHINQQGEYTITSVSANPDTFMIIPPENSGLVTKTISDTLNFLDPINVTLESFADVGIIPTNSTIVTPTYVDTEPPKFVANKNIIIDATAANGAKVTFDNPVASDNVAVLKQPECKPKSGSFFPIGATTVHCKAEDNSGNIASTTFTVNVKSKIAVPVVIPTTLTLDIGKNFYEHDDAIFVKGAATPVTEKDVIF